MERLNRSETLQILRSLGVEIPPHTKLADDALEKRLTQALNASQSLTAKKTIAVPSLRRWPSSSGSVYDSIRRGNMAEAMANVASGSAVPDLYVNAFIDVRQTLMAFSTYWDQGLRCFLIQDAAKEDFAINLRIVDVFQLDEKTPLLLVVYNHFTKGNLGPGVRWVQEKIRMGQEAGVPGMPNVTTTLVEHKLLLKILSLNSSLLPDGYTVKKTPAEANFKISFFVPLAPLDFKDVSKLNSDTGCVVCGDKTASRCSQCQAVAYCGKECQKLDWSSHKSTCRSLKDGKWHTIRLQEMPAGMENAGGFMTVLNYRSSPSKDIRAMSGDREPPVNVHGSKVFLIKMQRTLGAGNVSRSMMIYDRQRSFTMYYAKTDDQKAVFDSFHEEMLGPRGGYNGLKMYRWAKRVSDWELSVCLDKEPKEPVPW